MSKDEGTREGTTVEAISGLTLGAARWPDLGRQRQPVFDGAGACVVTSESTPARRASSPGPFPSVLRVAGCEPDEMGIGPVFAVPKVLKSWASRSRTSTLWELNEAFAVQVLYCRDSWASRRPPERQRRRHCPGPPPRCQRPAPTGPRPHRRQAPWRQARVRDHVHRWRRARGRFRGCCYVRFRWASSPPRTDIPGLWCRPRAFWPWA